MSAEARSRRNKVSRREAERARAELQAGGLSHHDKRRLQTIIRTRERASRRRRQALVHLMIAVLGGLAVMAVAGAALGFVPAIEAATGNGTVGTYVVGSPVCGRHGCVYTGTFEARDGDVFSHVAYEGRQAAGAAPGTRIPARYTGYRQAYPLQGSLTWAVDLVLMLLSGSVVALLVWLLPVGLRQRRAESSSDPDIRDFEI
jgi:hypothetical protein